MPYSVLKNIVSKDVYKPAVSKLDGEKPIPAQVFLKKRDVQDKLIQGWFKLGSSEKLLGYKVDKTQIK